MNAPYRGKLTWDPKQSDWRDSMTLDHSTQAPINPDPFEPKALPAPFNLEDTSMVREFAARISNMIVDASQVAVDVKALRTEMDSLRDALAVANEQARRAIEERDQARAGEATAIKQREMADKAYETVNAQRIDAENSLTQVRSALNEAERDLDLAKADLDFRASELDRLNNLLSIADREREEWRSKWDHERDRADLAELERNERIDELEQTNVRLRHLAEANDSFAHEIDRHRSTFLETASHISFLETKLEASNMEAGVLREQIAILETANQNVHRNNHEMLEQITAARRVLNHHHDALKVLD